MTKNTINITFFLLSKLLLLSFFLLFSLYLNAQLPEDIFLGKDISAQELDKQKWEEITSDMDYSGQPEELVEEEKGKDSFGDQAFREISNSGGGSLFGAGLFKGFAIVFLIAVVVMILLFLVKDGLPNNEKVEKTVITLENIEDNIHETDLERFIREAKEKGDYALAMRLYYLSIIKELSLKKLIKWKRDKTNGEYLRELRSSNFFTEFNEVTNIFERIWYGGGKIDAGTFAGFEGKFRGLVDSVKK
ncbi:MAG: hypothetical protein ACI85O_000473 [Saprospiraceae bacterium]|jgi:hypothetical protein